MPTRLLAPPRHTAPCAWLLILLAGCSPDGGEGQKPEIRLEAPRDYAYVIGDRIEHTLTLRLASGESLDLSALPQPGPINDWLMLRDSRWEPAPEDETLRLHVTYQIFKGVRTPEQVTGPPLALRLQGREARTVATPEWTFTLAPVIPPDETDETLSLRDPQPPLPATSADLIRRLGLSLLGLGIVGLLWGLRAFLRRRKTRPFARARWELRGALATRHDLESLRRAARSLHRAFDHTFGETLFPGEIERFCQANPTFAPLDRELAAFFQWSQTLFFDPAAATIEPRTHDWLIDLAGRFAAAERKAS